MVIEVLAENRAKKMVKELLRRRGEKVSAYSAAEIKVMAEMWLAMHRDEAIADAKHMIAGSPELTKMFEKEQRQRAKLLTNAQLKIRGNQWLRLCRCQVQNDRRIRPYIDGWSDARCTTGCAP